MSKKYLIIENSDSPHEDGLNCLVEILRFSGSNITLYLSRGNEDRAIALGIDKKVSSIIVENRWYNIFKYIKTARDYDCVIYHTISVRNTMQLFIFAILSRVSPTLFIRNINSWFSYSFHHGQIKQVIARNLSIFFKKILIKKSNSVIVENDRLRFELNAKAIHKVDVIPFRALKVSEKDSNFEIFKFVVPGVIDFDKKNLQMILDAFALLPADIRIQSKLIFLGKTKKKSDESICKQYKFEFGNMFEYFTHFIDTKTYEDIFDDASAVMSSYFSQHVCEHFNEIYGRTKGSAVDAHAISRSLPLFINDLFDPDRNYINSTIVFHDKNDLSARLNRFVVDSIYRDSLMKNAKVESEYFELENVAKRLQFL